MSTDAALLRARGTEIIAGDRHYRIRFDFDALERIEAEYDGLDNFISQLSAWKTRFRTVRFALVEGLARDLSPEEVAAHLNQNEIPLATLIEIINSALEEALGLSLTASGEEDDPKVPGSEDSLGGGSTSMPPSAMDGQMPSFGE